MTKALSIILLAAVMTSCTKGGNTIEVPDPSDAPSTKPLVTVVYDPDALGDHSYNDLICQGVEAAANKYGIRTMQLSPVSKEEGLAYLETDTPLEGGSHTKIVNASCFGNLATTSPSEFIIYK